MEAYKRPIFLGIILIALGVVANTSLAGRFGALGTVWIAVGGLFFIIGMKKKKDQEQSEE